MPDKTLEEYQLDEKVSKTAEQERRISDGKYAIKLVQQIVFWFIAALAGGLILTAIDLVARKVFP